MSKSLLGDWHIALDEGSNAGSNYVPLLRLSDIDSLPETSHDESGSPAAEAVLRQLDHPCNPLGSTQ